MSDVKIKDNTPEFLDALKTAKEKALWAIGATAELHAKEITPVDTGRLRNSITHQEDDDASYIGTNVEYAPYIELGTSRNKAHHMLKRAATEHSAEYQKLLKDAMENG